MEILENNEKYIDYAFSIGIFNIKARINFEEEDSEEDDFLGYYDSDELKIVLNWFLLKKQYNPKKTIKRTVIHELTHLFDYNCWNSWAYKDKDSHEHYAVFTENFHEVIEGIWKEFEPIIDVFLEPKEEKEKDKNE